MPLEGLNPNSLLHGAKMDLQLRVCWTLSYDWVIFFFFLRVQGGDDELRSSPPLQIESTNLESVFLLRLL